MFNDRGLRRQLSEGADYCFISVGINDTYKKMGADYFAHHTCLILRFMLQNGITPILLEIPDYDIAYTYEHQTVRKKLLRQLSMGITHSTLDCREDYRQALRTAMEEERLASSIVIIANQHWDASLYAADRMHLNKRGYQVLDSLIVKHLLLRMNT
jgi:lysophospholipase L1-like esterase